jgi:lipoate-protein ligase A
VTTFNRLLVYYDSEPRAAAMNMAVDETLLQDANAPAIRFYRWARPAVSFGYFGQFADVAPFERDRELVRRWTGGGIVLHGSDITYSIIVPRMHPFFESGTAASYAAIHEGVREVLQASGRETQLAEQTTTKVSDACFANPARSDVLIGETKIAGAAQRRTRVGLLHQGSIQYAELPLDFRSQFARALSRNVEEREITNATVLCAEEIARRRYATSEWLRRR